MRNVPVLSGGEAAKLIADSAVITISSSSGLGCPDAVLKAIGQRFKETGSPGNLTTLHPIAAGDMYGIKGIDHLCRPGQLRRVLAGSYPSGGSKLDPPLIRQLIHNDQIQALNIPSGVLFQMHRAASTGQPGVLTEVGLGTYADPRLEGAKMNAVTDDFVQLMQVDGDDYLFYPAVHVDVAIIRATTADPHGTSRTRKSAARSGHSTRLTPHTTKAASSSPRSRDSPKPSFRLKMSTYPGSSSTPSLSTPIRCKPRRPSTTPPYPEKYIATSMTSSPSSSVSKR